MVKLTKRFHRCPQCIGTGEFMKFECFVCEGKGKVNPDAE